MNASFVTSREAKRILGVSDSALRKWADQKLFPSIRTPAGHRLYDVKKFVEDRDEKDLFKEETIQQKICYCRVSSANQKDDLQRQVLYMSKQFPNHRIITDIGSGINFRRKGLCTMLDLASKGSVSEIVVAYRDRLCRFAFELLERVFQLNEVKLVVLNKEMDSSGQSELAEDLLAIVNVFNCRVNGRRKYKTKKEESDKSRNQSEEPKEDKEKREEKSQFIDNGKIET